MRPKIEAISYAEDMFTFKWTGQKITTNKKKDDDGSAPPKINVPVSLLNSMEWKSGDNIVFYALPNIDGILVTRNPENPIFETKLNYNLVTKNKWAKAQEKYERAKKMKTIDDPFRRNEIRHEFARLAFEFPETRNNVIRTREEWAKREPKYVAKLDRYYTLSRKHELNKKERIELEKIKTEIDEMNLKRKRERLSTLEWMNQHIAKNRKEN